MNFSDPGKSISDVELPAAIEVVNISSHGFWIFDERSGQEFFLPYAKFPWFAGATVAQISNVERQGVTVLHWPDLDVDLDLERIRFPERFPLQST